MHTRMHATDLSETVENLQHAKAVSAHIVARDCNSIRKGGGGRLEYGLGRGILGYGLG